MSNSISTSQDTDYVRIFDTTLRDGEQAPGCTMNVEEKIAIARQLERLNVDVIEAGFAASSPGDFEAVSRIAQTVSSPRVLSLSRTRIEDVDSALSAGLIRAQSDQKQVALLKEKAYQAAVEAFVARYAS